MKVFLVLAGAILVAVSIKAADQAHPNADFESFKAFHGKVYPSAAEEAAAKATFDMNAAAVEAHNAAFADGTVTHVKELNKFSDIDPAVFRKRNGFRPSTVNSSIAIGLDDAQAAALQLNGAANAGAKAAAAAAGINAALKLTSPLGLRSTAPASFDWRKYGKVSPVYNQGSCESCWTFSAAQAMESQILIKGHPLMQLSEQQIVDCDSNNCQPGNYEQAWTYIYNNGGLDSLSSYPYISQHGQTNGYCQYSPAAATATVTNYYQISSNYASIKKALYNYGPLSIAIDSRDLQLHSDGVYSCPAYPKTDHAVLLVGYGTAQDGTAYWIVKNSWGTNWGNRGFFYLAQGTGDCGMSSFVAYPTVSVLKS